MAGKFLLYPCYWLIVNLFLILRLKVIILTDSLSTDTSIPSSVNLAINKPVTTINFDKHVISKLIVALNPYKAHGHDDLSIRMLEMGSKSL